MSVSFQCAGHHLGCAYHWLTPWFNVANLGKRTKNRVFGLYYRFFYRHIRTTFSVIPYVRQYSRTFARFLPKLLTVKKLASGQYAMDTTNAASGQFTFPDFIAKFPQVQMPIILGETTHHVFGKENEPLPLGMIQQFVYPIENIEETDEFTEYIPCFSIEGTGDFIAIVWWKAELLNYEYRLATFSLTGKLLSSRVIAYTRVQKGQVHRAVATIDTEWEINIAVGTTVDGNDVFDPSTTRTANLDLLANGQIIDYHG